jgi:hypothetical protein
VSCHARRARQQVARLGVTSILEPDSHMQLTEPFRYHLDCYAHACRPESSLSGIFHSSKLEDDKMPNIPSFSHVIHQAVHQSPGLPPSLSSFQTFPPSPPRPRVSRSLGVSRSRSSRIPEHPSDGLYIGFSLSELYPSDSVSLPWTISCDRPCKLRCTCVRQLPALLF